MKNVTKVGSLGPIDDRTVPTPSGAGPWDLSGTTVYPDNASWNVVVGAGAMSGSGEKFRVVGEVRFSASVTFEQGGGIVHDIQAEDSPPGDFMYGDAIDITPGDAGAASAGQTAGEGGRLQVLTGAGANHSGLATWDDGGKGGNFTIICGNGGQARADSPANGGAGGDIDMTAGRGGTGDGATTDAGAGGDARLRGGQGGQVNGTGTWGAGGEAELAGGSATPTGDGDGGNALVTAGPSGVGSGDGGDAIISGGNTAGLGSGDGGDVIVGAGSAGSGGGDGGDVLIDAGNAPAGNIGIVALGRTYGDVVVGAGAMSGGGEKLRVYSAASAGNPLMSVGYPNDFVVLDFEYAGGFVRQVTCTQPVGAGYAPGTPIQIIAGTGQDTAGFVGEGGFIRINAGRGGDNTGADDDGGWGAEMSIYGGVGGETAAATFAGGQGGPCNVAAGRGGTGTATADGGRGGNLDLRAGQGGLATGTGAEGDGGETTVIGGMAGGPAGAGGDIYIYAGAKGTDVPGGASGNTYIRAGQFDALPPLEGIIYIGDDWCSQIDIGHGSIPINFVSTSAVQFVGDIEPVGDISYPHGNHLLGIKDAPAATIGGNMTIDAGKGGDNAAGIGAVGGDVNIDGGAGGDTTTVTAGGVGGAVYVGGGTGGNISAGSGNGGAGGATQLQAGTGGQGALGANAGSGGDALIDGGSGGTATGGGSAGLGGNVIINAGPAGSPLVADGRIDIGVTTGTGVTIGRAGGQIGFYGGPVASRPNITGALTLVADANAKAVLTSIIAAFTAVNLATDGTT